MTGEPDPADALRPPGDALAERGREVVAARLGYPPGTVEAERQIEAACPGWVACYSDGTVQGRPPRFSAKRRNARYADPEFWGATAAEVIAQIQAHQEEKF